MPQDELPLLQAAREGDAHAMDELLARHEQQVYRFALRMCGSEEEAKEVLQQTLLAAFKGLHEFRGDAALSTWLYQIARSYCLKLKRRGAGEPAEHEPLEASPAQAVPSAEAGPEEAAHARQIAEALQVAIQALRPNYREALILRDVEGLSTEEAARVVGIEERALKSRLHRARMELRESLSALLDASSVPSSDRCPELTRELAAYAGEDIDQATCVRIEDHLARCPRCADACESLKRSVSLCRHLPGGGIPPTVKAAVRHALLGLTSSSPPPSPRSPDAPPSPEP